MGAMNASAWLLPAWKRSLATIGATAPESDIEAFGRALIERWNAPDRKHHNLRRLVSVLARVDELAAETHSPDLVRVAAWYHGAVFHTDQTRVYRRRGGIDEQASASLAQDELADLGVPGENIARVVALIGSLAGHHVSDGDLDAMALRDAHLGGLAVEPQKYATYRREVREEYSHIPEVDYFQARLAIVDKLLGRRKLFTSPMGQAWEERARENLTAERARIQAQLGKISGTPPLAGPTGAGTRSGENVSFFAGKRGPAPVDDRPRRFAPLPTSSLPIMRHDTPPQGAPGPPSSPAAPVEPPRTRPTKPRTPEATPSPTSPSAASPTSPASAASPADEARPLIRDFPKGQPYAPRVRRINPEHRGIRRTTRDTDTGDDRGEGSSEDPDDGSTMTRPPER